MHSSPLDRLAALTLCVERAVQTEEWDSLLTLLDACDEALNDVEKHGLPLEPEAYQRINSLQTGALQALASAKSLMVQAAYRHTQVRQALGAYPKV